MQKLNPILDVQFSYNCSAENLIINLYWKDINIENAFVKVQLKKFDYDQKKWVFIRNIATKQIDQNGNKLVVVYNDLDVENINNEEWGIHAFITKNKRDEFKNNITEIFKKIDILCPELRIESIVSIGLSPIKFKIVYNNIPPLFDLVIHEHRYSGESSDISNSLYKSVPYRIHQIKNS